MRRKRSFCSRDIPLLVFLSSPLFFPFSLFSHCWIYRRSWLKINPKVYDLMICLNSNNTNCFISWEVKKVWNWNFVNTLSIMWDSLHYLEPSTSLKVKLLHGCFSSFLDCTNGTKSLKVSDIRKTFMGKICWKCAQETSSRPPFNFSK